MIWQSLIKQKNDILLGVKRHNPPTAKVNRLAGFDMINGCLHGLHWYRNGIVTIQAELYGKIHSLIYQDQPYMFLYNRHSLFGFNKKLRGYRFSPRGPFHYSPGIDAIWSP